MTGGTGVHVYPPETHPTANGELRRLRLLIQPWFRKDLCSDEPWLILHKIDTAEKMRVWADALAECLKEREAKAQAE